MYESFFGLDDLPFRLTPDPRYLFMSAKHREAFAHLVYGVNEGSGFVAITGEVGAGKTTLVRALLREAGENVVIIYIVNPVLTSTELLQTINAELELPSATTSRKELMESLAGFLRRTSQEGGRTVVIVDEAQNLDPVVLEQLRLLSNLETETEKLIQIVLIGQPELHTLLERHDLRQLNQRVTVRWHLEQLDRAETHEYLRHRLAVAGCSNELFQARAVDLIFQYSQGVPRLINILAHRAMLVAYTRNVGKVGTAEVGGAARELGHGSGPVRVPAGGAFSKVAIGAGVAMAAGIAAFFLMGPMRDAGPRGASAVQAAPGLDSAVVTEATASAVALSVDSQPEPSAASLKSPPLTAEPPAAPALSEEVPALVPEVAETEQQRSTGVRLGDDAEAAEFVDADVPAHAQGAGTQEVEAEEPTASAELSPEETTPAEEPARIARVTEAAVIAGEDEAAAALAKQLTEQPAFGMAADSLSALLELWGAASLSAAERGGETLDLGGLAKNRGLRYLAAEMNFAFLSKIDVPAILELTPSGSTVPRYVLVRSYRSDLSRLLLLGDVEVPRALLEKWWNGRAHVVWRDAESLGYDLGPGTGGPSVRKLQTLLTEAGAYDGNAHGLFDDLTENAVRRFQESGHIIADGIAGPVTQILLYNSIERFPRPRLTRAVGEKNSVVSDE